MSKEKELIELMTENFGSSTENPFEEEPDDVVIIDD